MNGFKDVATCGYIQRAAYGRVKHSVYTWKQNNTDSSKHPTHDWNILCPSCKVEQWAELDISLALASFRNSIMLFLPSTLLSFWVSGIFLVSLFPDSFFKLILWNQLWSMAVRVALGFSSIFGRRCFHGTACVPLTWFLQVCSLCPCRWTGRRCRWQLNMWFPQPKSRIVGPLLVKKKLLASLHKKIILGILVIKRWLGRRIACGHGMHLQKLPRDWNLVVLIFFCDSFKLCAADLFSVWGMLSVSFWRPTS